MTVRRFLFPLFIAIGLLAAGAPAGAQTQLPDAPLADPGLEMRARDLMKQVRCVVCQAQSIDESDAGIAADMRRLIREKIAAGESDEAILKYLVDRYGDFVLFKPPFKATTALLWAGPFLLLGFGGLMMVVFFRRRAAPAPLTLSADERRRVEAALDAASPAGQERRA